MTDFFCISWYKKYHLYIETKDYYGIYVIRCDFCNNKLPTKKKIYIITVENQGGIYYVFCNESCFNLAVLSSSNKGNFKIIEASKKGIYG